MTIGSRSEPGTEVRPRIGIWGHYHGRNLGDDVVVSALIQNIRARRPDATLLGISLAPEDTWRRHGIPALSMVTGEQRGPEEGDDDATRRQEGLGLPEPVSSWAEGVSGSRWRVAAKLGRWVLGLHRTLTSYGNLAPVSMVLVAGSGPVSDTWSGPWAHPYRMFRWAGLTRLAGGRFLALSVGEGPINASLSRFFLALALRLSAYRSFRDPQSLAVAESLGTLPPSYAFPDLAFSLEAPSVAEARREAEHPESTGIVGVSTMAHKDPRYFPRGDLARHRVYVHKLTGLCEWLLDRGYRVQLLRSHVAADERVARDLVQALESRRPSAGDAIRIAPTQTHQDLLDQVAACDLVVGGRFHCHVLPLLLHKPVLGLAYHPKIVELMEYMGQSRYCLHTDRTSVGEMVERFQELEGKWAEVRRELSWRVEACRAALALQYDVVVGRRSPEAFRGRVVHLPGHPGYTAAEFAQRPGRPTSPSA